MDSVINITLIRHTSVKVEKGFIYGKTDIPLNETFHFETGIIHKKLKQHYQAVYTSPSKRCLDLSNQLWPHKNKFQDKRLMELNFGDWEGNNWNNIDQTAEASYWFNDFINQQCPNGESYADLLTRIHRFIKSIQQSNLTNIAIVTHGGPIRAFLSILNKIDPLKIFNQKINFGEVITLTISKNNEYELFK